MFVLFGYWGVLFCASIIYCQELSPIVTLSDGKVQGTIHRTAQDGKVYYAYRGIPFAKKPVSDLRFAAPVSNDPWTGVLNATSDKDSCTQMHSDSQTVIGSEDCLYINVYTTTLTRHLPVIVWIYGGGFVAGSSDYNTYAPDYILNKDVLYVSFNYRLGVFGFLSTADSAATGNWGLKDQILALKWVKNNIANFGGDPDKITIFGESAGAASVSYLLNTPLTKGLYHAAIMQSGTGLCLWGLSRNAKTKAHQVARSLLIFEIDSTTLIQRLRRVDYRRLKKAESDVTSNILISGDVLAGLPFGVVQEPDHPGAVLSGRTYEILANGEFNRVPSIIGYNSNELAMRIRGANYLLISGLLNLKLLTQNLAPYDLTNIGSNMREAGFKIKKRYIGNPLILDLDDFFKFATVDQFNRPIRKTVNMISRYSDVYFYKFCYEGELGNPNRSEPGVQHAEDMSYIFYKNVSVSEEDALTVKRLVTLWTNFAKTGKPTSSEGDGYLPDITWIPNTPSTNASESVVYLNINNTVTMQENPDQSDWLFYKDIYDTYGDPTYHTTY